MSSFSDTNLANWNERADIHIEDLNGSYGIERLLAGEDVLFPIEAGEIGDIAGLKVLHLQCHIGIDTLCLARRGAEVTGLDFSPPALGHARDLAARTGLRADFVHGDVYHAPELVADDFDLVYTTWGTINWLPDIRRWAAVVAAVLKPGGRLYFADGHPSAQVLEEIDGRLVPTYGFRTPHSVPLDFINDQTYTGDPRQLANNRNFEWIHPLGDVLTALIDAGLTIRRVSEHEAVPWQMVPMMRPGEDRLWRLPPGLPAFPLSVTIDAVKG